YHREHPGPARGMHPGLRAGAVTHLLGELPDSFTGFGIDPARPGERTGDGGRRHSRGLGDVIDGHRTAPRTRGRSRAAVRGRHGCHARTFADPAAPAVAVPPRT